MADNKLKNGCRPPVVDVKCTISYQENNSIKISKLERILEKLWAKESYRTSIQTGQANICSAITLQI